MIMRMLLTLNLRKQNETLTPTNFNMAVICPKCKSQYDITLFQFGRTLKCDCGYVINPNKFNLNKSNIKKKGISGK